MVEFMPLIEVGACMEEYQAFELKLGELDILGRRERPKHNIIDAF